MDKHHKIIIIIKKIISETFAQKYNIRTNKGKGDAVLE